MSDKKNTLVTQLSSSATIKNQPFSLAAAFSSPPTVVRFLDNCSFQINVLTTDSTGTFAVEVSNDYYVNEGNNSVVTNPGTWVPLTLAGASNAGIPTVAAADTNITISLNQLPFYAVRLSYAPTVAGTGLASIFVTDKQV